MPYFNMVGEQGIICGRLHSVGAHSDFRGTAVWFAYQLVSGDHRWSETSVNDDGEFAFELPIEPLSNARIGAYLEGVEPVDLQPNGTVLEPGDLMLLVNDIVPSHLRFGSA